MDTHPLGIIIKRYLRRSLVTRSLIVIIVFSIVTVSLSHKDVLEKRPRVLRHRDEATTLGKDEHVRAIFRHSDLRSYSDPVNEAKRPYSMNKRLPGKWFKSSGALVIDVLSSKERATISVNGEVVHDSEARGVHCVVLNQVSGRVMTSRVFDFYIGKKDAYFIDFLNAVADRRIIVFAIKDDGSFRMGKSARTYLTLMGSKHAQTLAVRYFWAMVVQRSGPVYEEAYNEARDFIWGNSVAIRVKVPKAKQVEDCSFSIAESAEERTRRREFCRDFDGFGNTCNCEKPAPISFHPEDFPDNMIKDVPVAVIASNRPHELHRMLPTLLSALGVNPAMVTVFVDGHPTEAVAPMAVARLFGANAVSRTPGPGMLDADGRVRQIARITAHYKTALSETFKMFPKASHVIVVEDDLEILPDFFSYFSQSKKLLEEDDSIFCVSAWNDNGFAHSSSNAAMLYRVESMPGLGWMIRRSLFQELEEDWPKPSEDVDWSTWIRRPEIMKGRECVIPDVSRTYHFGESGVNVNAVFQDEYFVSKPRKMLPFTQLNDVDSLKKENYDEVIERVIKSGRLIDHTKTPCVNSRFPNPYNESTALLMYIEVEEADTAYRNWIAIAKCFKLWDRGPRGQHKAMWRFHLFNVQIMVIGVPKSPYSKYLPKGVTPISMAGAYIP